MRILGFWFVAILAVAAGAFIAAYNWIYPDVTVVSNAVSLETCDNGSDSVPWPTRSPSDAGFDESKLNDLTASISSGQIPGIHSVLVVRAQDLIFEEYFAGEDWIWARPQGLTQFNDQTLHDLRSVTKSIISILYGIAIEDGVISDLDRPILDILSNYKPRLGFDLSKRIENITLRDALTMTAGLGWDELSHPYWHPENDESAMWRQSDPVAYALTRPVIAEPGETFTYNGGLPTLLAASLEALTGMDVVTYAHTKLFCPLGIQSYEWVMHNPSGVPVAASGLRLTPRDMARIGLLMANDGKWQDEQLASSEFAEEAISPLTETNSPIAPGYGYQWWITPMETNFGKVDVPMAMGNGGQRIILFEPAELVVVMTAGNYNSPTQGEPSRQVFEAILDALPEKERPTG